jgi:hypothetical protein
MEAPSSWGALEHTIADALEDHEKSMHDGRIGLSQVRMIADRLRAAGFVCDSKNHGNETGGCECLAGNCTC